MGMNEQDDPWATWRSLKESRADSAESYTKNHPAESPRPRRNKYGVPRFRTPVLSEVERVEEFLFRFHRNASHNWRK